MISSIFSSDAWTRARAVPRRVFLRWFGYAVAGGAVIALCGAILGRVNPSTQRWHLGAAEILFVGTSHAANGIDANVFAGTAGVVSFQGLDHQLAKATIVRHAGRWPRLAWAVLEVDEFSLLTDMTQAGHADPRELLATLDLPLTALPPATGRGTWWKTRMVLSGKGTAALHSDLRLTTQRLFYDRREAPAPDTLELTASAGTSRARYLARIGTGQVTDNIRALVDLTRWLTARGVKVALLSYPQHAHYRAARPAEWDRQIAQAVAAVNAEVNDVPYWSYRANGAFDDGDFKNVDHLNARGATKLSRMVARRLPVDSVPPP